MPRPRLVERVGRPGPADLVSAPAGFGKTTLLTQALAAGRSLAWVSVDDRDDEPVRFWTYVLTALQARGGRARPAAVDRRRARRRAERPQARPDPLTLVIDDYHLVESRDVHDGMAFLLDHLPPNVRLVIATRADPPLPLSRLRARGELVEVRAADLRFTDGRGRRLPRRDDGPRAGRRRRRRAGRAHRGLGRRPPAGRAVAAGPRRPRRLRRRVRGRRPVHRRLPRRRGAGPASPRTSTTSCCGRPSSRGSPARCATPSPGRAGAPRGSSPSTGRTSSSSRSTTTASGTATTTCSPTSCARTCSTSGPTRSPSCTGGPATG